MNHALSLHIGIEACDYQHYDNSSFTAPGAEQQARHAQFICKKAGFKSVCLLSEKATRKSVYGAFKKASQEIKNDGVFLFSYNGVAGYLPNPSDGSENSLIPTWCLYDGQILLREVNQLLTIFHPKVAVYFVDSEPENNYQDVKVDEAISAGVYFNNMSFYNQLLSSMNRKFNEGAVTFNHIGEGDIASLLEASQAKNVNLAQKNSMNSNEHFGAKDSEEDT